MPASGPSREGEPPNGSPARAPLVRALQRLAPTRIFPVDYEPVITALSVFLWGYPLSVPAVVLLNRDGTGGQWWFGFAVLCATVLLIPWRYRHAGRGGPRGAVSGVIDMGLAGVALALASWLADAPEIIRIQFNSLVMLLTFIYPYLYSGRTTTVVAAASYAAMFGATAFTHVEFAPEHRIPWQPMLISSWPYALVAAGMSYFSHLLRQQATARQRLAGMAMTDALTGLYGRALFIDEGERCVTSAARGGPPCSLILADLDGLKDINDSFGHATGDASLRHFGQALRTQAGPRDIVARLGGDEFAILALHGAGGVPEVIERYRPTLDHTLFREQVTHTTIRLSASWGLATATSETENLISLFAQADEQLIRHKAVARPLPPPETADPPFVPRGRRALAEALASLIALARDLAAATDGAGFLRGAATGAAELLGARSATVSMVRGGTRWGYRARRSGAGWEYEDAEFPNGRSIIQHVLDTRLPYVTNDIEQDPIADREAARRMGIHSCLCVPVHGVDNEVTGTLFLADKLGRAPYTEHDVQVAQAFADLAGAALQKTEALHEARHKSGNAEAILRAVARVHGTMALDGVLQRVVVEAATLLDADAALLALPQPDGTLHIAAEHGQPPGAAGTPLPRIGEGLLGTVAATGVPVLVNALATDPVVRPNRDARLGDGAQLIVPVLGSDGEILGVFGLASRAPESRFTTQHQALLEAFAGHVAFTLEARTAAPERSCS